MSFASDVKNEICLSQKHGKDCCLLAECYGILLFAGAFHAGGFKIMTKNAAFAERVPWLFEKVFGAGVKTAVTETKEGSPLYFLSEASPGAMEAIFAGLSVSPAASVSLTLIPALLRTTCCKKAFMRGAFLAGGTLTDPEKAYYLEFSTPRMAVAAGFKAFLAGELEAAPKKMMRKSNYVLYYKESEHIEDLLTLIGAVSSALKMMEVKVVRDVRNHVNRVTNCETANITKTVYAAASQLEAVERIRRKRGLSALSGPLRQAAELRRKYPEASLAELAALADPPVSRSGLNLRLKKLAEIAEGL